MIIPSKIYLYQTSYLQKKAYLNYYPDMVNLNLDPESWK